MKLIQKELEKLTVSTGYFPLLDLSVNRSDSRRIGNHRLSLLFARPFKGMVPLKVLFELPLIWWTADVQSETIRLNHEIQHR